MEQHLQMAQKAMDTFCQEWKRYLPGGRLPITLRGQLLLLQLPLSHIGRVAYLPSNYGGYALQYVIEMPKTEPAE